LPEFSHDGRSSSNDDARESANDLLDMAIPLDAGLKAVSADIASGGGGYTCIVG